MDRDGKTRVLIAGGGVAGLEAALALRALAAEHVSVEVLAPDLQFWYRPLSVVAPFGSGEVRHFELDGLTRTIGAAFTPGAITAVEEWRHLAHTSHNTEIEYDKLLIACGAVPAPAVPGALTFRGPADIDRIAELVAEIEQGAVRSVVFAVPWGAVWSLPAYELVLLTAARLEERGVRGVELAIATPERKPLQLFGSAASETMGALLETRGVQFHAGVYPRELAAGALRLVPEGAIQADRVVALPRLRGAPIDGLPQTVDGFIPVDAHGRVEGVEDVFAAGDITSFTVKQGGLATQQADAAAEAIAAEAGADLTPSRFRPVLRGVLLTGDEPRYLRRALSGADEREGRVTANPLWWPPVKVVGRYLAPFLASASEEESPAGLPNPGPRDLQIELELEPELLQELEVARLTLDDKATDAEDTVGRAMAAELLVAAPEDTLGEIAERLLAEDATAAVICEFGLLLGIVTTADLLHAYAAGAHPSEARARQWMTAEPVTVESSASTAVAATLMREHDIHHLVVVTDDRPVGILGYDEVLSETRAPVELGL